jgi:hypothetical protein
MEEKNTVIFFLDEDQTPIAEFASPVHFDLDTFKMVDGIHSLKIISKDPDGQEDMLIIPFEIKNRPGTGIEGVRENLAVPLMVNAYGQSDERGRAFKGIEKARSMPAWIWVLFIGFLGCCVYYIIKYSELFSK